MSNFDTLFFEQHISPDEKIERVFHRHIFVMIEDIIIWIFFGIIIPAFLFYFDVFFPHEQIDVTYVYTYLFFIYFILLYKIFDWYLDVWIATDHTLIEMTWKWFTPQLVYTPYDKIEGIEIRTRSWFHSLIGISDVSINLVGEWSHTLSSAAKPRELLIFLQDAVKGEWAFAEKDKEPFELLVDALSGVVKDHLSTNGKEYITRDYVEKLDHTLSHGIPIDLRSSEEKVIIQNWKTRNQETIDDEKNSKNL